MTSTATSLSADLGTRFYTATDFDFAARTALGHAAQGVVDIGMVLTTLAAIPDGGPEGWFDAWYRAAESPRAARRHPPRGRPADQRGAFYLAARRPTTKRWRSSTACRTTPHCCRPSASTVPPGTPSSTPRTAGTCGWRSRAATSRCPATCCAPMPPAPAVPQWSSPTAVTDRSPVCGQQVSSPHSSAAGTRSSSTAPVSSRCCSSATFRSGTTGRQFSPRSSTGSSPDRTSIPTGCWASASARPGTGCRARAFEHRLRAAVVDSGVIDVARAWNVNLPPEMLQLLKDGQADTFNHLMGGPADPQVERTFAFRASPYGADKSPFELFTEVNRYTLYDVAGGITTPLLTTDPQDDQFFPGQPQELYNALTCEKKLVTFTRDQGAASHCEPLARGQVALVMNDWFAEHLSEE